MKVLIINGSPRKDGNCDRLIKEAVGVLNEEGIDCEIYKIGDKIIRGCVACGHCNTAGKCAFDDDVNVLAEKLDKSDGLIIASPVYYGSANGTLVSLLNRLFYSSRSDKRMKIGAAFAVARRAGTVAAFDDLTKYFTISQMPVASGRYWNNGFGRERGQIEEDKEGLQNARIVARNMAFLIKSVRLGIEKYGLPELEKPTPTSFIK